MTELSYTAWDDNRYQWPPPDGWYQASDGKWWPQGYGPVEAVESTVSSDDHKSEYVPPDEGAHGVGSETIVESDQAEVNDDWETVAAVHSEAEAEIGEATHEGDIAEEGETKDLEFAETVDVGETGDYAAPEIDAEEADAAAAYQDIASGFADSGETSYTNESSLTRSSVGMAASGFSGRAEGGSSSLGLAGWAQTGPSDVGNGVDSREHDYESPEYEAEDLAEPVDNHDSRSDEFAAPDTDETDITFDSGATTEAASAGAASLDSAALDPSALDTPADEVDSTLSRLDDLKRQVEQQNFRGSAGAVEGTTPVSDLDVEGFDPTETLDIDPNDLTLETNPYYGASDEAVGYDPSPGVDATEAMSVDNGHETDHGHDTDQGFHDHVDAGPESAYAYGSIGDATVEVPPPADAPLEYEEGAAVPAGEQLVAVDDGYRDPPADYSAGPVLTPMSTPPPKGGRSLLLYAVIGLLALAIAGVAGYLLFQLQDEEATETGDGEGTEAASAVGSDGDAGPSNTSGQGAGSFAEPHELSGGVRLTVPVGDATEVWMLQVREPATTSDMGDDQVEVTSRLRVRNDSTSGDLSASGLRFVLVSADGASGTTATSSCSAGDDLDRQKAIEPGKDVEGNVCWVVPAAQADGALLGIESVNAGGRVHVNLS